MSSASYQPICFRWILNVEKKNQTSSLVDGMPRTFLSSFYQQLQNFRIIYHFTNGNIFLGRKCEAGWEQRGSANKKCLACPPGMYRPQADHLCQLCPKGLYSDQFGSASCVRCPLYHTTRGLGSKKASQCYYHRSATRSRMVDRQKKPARKKGSVEASFMRYYNRWSSRNQQQKRT